TSTKKHVVRAFAGMTIQCFSLLARFAVETERAHRRQVVEGEEHGFLVRAVAVQGPGRQREDVLLLPFEALASAHFSYLRPAAALRDLVDDAAGMAMRARHLPLAQELELRAHGRHDRAAGERIAVLVARAVLLELGVRFIPAVFELR